MAWWDDLTLCYCVLVWNGSQQSLLCCWLGLHYPPHDIKLSLKRALFGGMGGCGQNCSDWGAVSSWSMGQVLAILDMSTSSARSTAGPASTPHEGTPPPPLAGCSCPGADMHGSCWEASHACMAWWDDLTLCYCVLGWNDSLQSLLRSWLGLHTPPPTTKCCHSTSVVWRDGGVWAKLLRLGGCQFLEHGGDVGYP
jgi:hypothetical protein